jgi:hypothetical protein
MARRASDDQLNELLEVLASGVLSYAKACRAVGLSVRTFWEYVKRSRAGDEEMLIDWLGERVQFATAIGNARRMALFEARGRMEQRSILGHDEPIFFQGMPTWKPDPAVVGIEDPDIREMLTGLFAANQSGQPTPRTPRSGFPPNWAEAPSKPAPSHRFPSDPLARRPSTRRYFQEAFECHPQ